MMHRSTLYRTTLFQTGSRSAALSSTNGGCHQQNFAPFSTASAESDLCWPLGMRLPPALRSGGRTHAGWGLSASKAQRMWRTSAAHIPLAEQPSNAQAKKTYKLFRDLQSKKKSAATFGALDRVQKIGGANKLPSDQNC